MSTYDYVLQIHAGATTVVLTSAPWAILDYAPASVSGGMLAAESLSMRLADGSVANNMDEIHALQQIFLQAALAQTTRINRVYLEWKQTAAGDVWRSEIVGGQVELTGPALQRGEWQNNMQRVNIYLQRLPYWEGPEAQVPLTNGNGTDNTSGLQIFNHGDEEGVSPNKHQNWVQINPEDVLGDMPTPIRLEITNTYASDRLYSVWIGQNWTDPDNFTHIFESEAGTGGSSVASAQCSGGFYTHSSIPIGGGTYLLKTWTLSSAFLNSCKSGYFKFIARFPSSAPTQFKLKLELQYVATHIWSSGWVTMDTTVGFAIRDLFTFRLPPWLAGQTNLTSLDMKLYGIHNEATPQDFDLDVVQITPVDGYRYLQCAGYGVRQNERMIDDGIEGDIYVDNGAGSNKAGIVVGYGHPIALFPGKKQKLYFLQADATYASDPIARTATLKIFYRPRRATL